MSFDKDLDPSRWRAEKTVMTETINYWKETANHEMKQHAKYQKLYFEMKEKLERCQMGE
jgi:hypothetical protein